jgi:hypothetical protein
MDGGGSRLKEEPMSKLAERIKDLPSRCDPPYRPVTDLTSSTSLTQHLGDAKAQELLSVHNAIVRQGSTLR